MYVCHVHIHVPIHISSVLLVFIQNNRQRLCVFIVSTYTDGQPPSGVSWFCQWLEDTAADFRVQKSMLSGMRYAIFGLGNSEYGDNFNKVIQNLKY